MNSLSLKIDGHEFAIDAGCPLDISISLNFNGDQPNAYGVERASAEACRAGEMIGDTRRGGSVNFEQYKFIPHCSGTHTECVGHITHRRISVRDSLKDVFIPSVLISVSPENAQDSGETYAVEFERDDLLITRTAIEKALEKSADHLSYGLIIRTLPNDESKLAKTYAQEIPPFFSTEAMEFIRKRGVRQLLVDLPSIDRIFDQGKLANHRIFWNVAPGSFEISAKTLIHHTITELIYAPDAIADGNYLLNLQIAPFSADASPSRPVLFALK